MLGKKALFVGYGYAESQRFRELAAFFPKGESTLLLGEGRPFADPQIPEAVRASDVVFISMSETSPMEVNAARAVIELGKPFFLFAFHYYREEFAEVIPHAKAIFVIDKGDARGLLAKYPKANVVIMGEIGIEGAHKPPHTREQVRAKLGITSEEKFVLVVGGKEIAVNIPMAVSVMHAASQITNWKFRIVFTLHPGHLPLIGAENDQAALFENYKAELETRGKNLETTVTYRGEPFGLGTSAMVAGADLVVGPDSTDLLRAACLQIPAVAILVPRVFRGITLPENLREWWWPCSVGAIEAIDYASASKLGNLMRSLMSSTEKQYYMRSAQATHFKPVEVGTGYAIIKSAVEKAP